MCAPAQKLQSVSVLIGSLWRTQLWCWHGGSASPPCRGRSGFSATERGAGAGADVQPAVLVSGGGWESGWRTAEQCSADPGRHGGDAAAEAEVTKMYLCVNVMSDNLFTSSAGSSPVVQSAPFVLTQFPSKIVFPQILSGAHFCDVPQRISEAKVSKLLFYFYLSIRFSYFVDKTICRVCFCPNFHVCIYCKFSINTVGAMKTLPTRQICAT